MADTQKMHRVLVFMSDHGQDPTEVAVPWSILTKNGVTVEFATETGTEPYADPRMLEGPVSIAMGAVSSAKALYNELAKEEAWKHPHAWSQPSFSLESYTGVLLPGGHDKPMRQYLESQSLRDHLAAYFPTTRRDIAEPKAIAAICHGVVALARAKDQDGRSVLWNATTTALPVHMERTAYFATAPFLGDYYRTYTEYVADEVKNALADPKQYKSGGVLNMKPYVVVDPTYYYVSARFPGDAELFGETFLKMLKELDSR